MNILNIDYTGKTAPASLCESLKETGFAVLYHHPISVELIKNAYQQWGQFFYSDIKHDYLYQKSTQEGYFPFRTEKAKDYEMSDLKEFYHFYPWGRIPSEMKEITFSIRKELSQLAALLLQWIENFLPQKVAQTLSMPLSQMIEKSPNTLLRILHYPPIPKEINEKAVRAAAHEDINLITLLPAATAPGLEVLDTKGNWHSVDCDPGNIVVNVGDMLQLCTQYYYKSTTHRVVNPTHQKENISRFSMPLFLHPHPDVYLSETDTAKEYLDKRLREIGIR